VASGSSARFAHRCHFNHAGSITSWQQIGAGNAGSHCASSFDRMRAGSACRDRTNAVSWHHSPPASDDWPIWRFASTLDRVLDEPHGVMFLISPAASRRWLKVLRRSDIFYWPGSRSTRSHRHASRPTAVSPLHVTKIPQRSDAAWSDRQASLVGAANVGLLTISISAYTGTVQSTKGLCSRIS